MLWRNDPGLMMALNIARKFAEYAEFLIMLWPNIRMSLSPSSRRNAPAYVSPVGRALFARLANGVAAGSVRARSSVHGGGRTPALADFAPSTRASRSVIVVRAVTLLIWQLLWRRCIKLNVPN